TERYMRRPQYNEAGYREGAPVSHADKLKGNLLIVHGTTDDNVHWQNTVQFVDALQGAGKKFETMFYVNKNHGIGGGTTRVHLFEMITGFLLKNL
ncbi:MAG: prolyl oligopeptidase family serine peptidase, partial [Bacteroidota bacterium]